MFEYIYEIDARGKSPTDGMASKRRMFKVFDVEASGQKDVVREEWGPWEWKYTKTDINIKHAEYEPGYNYNAFLDGETGEVSHTGVYSDPSFSIGIGGDLSVDL